MWLSLSLHTVGSHGPVWKEHAKWSLNAVLETSRELSPTRERRADSISSCFFIRRQQICSRTWQCHVTTSGPAPEWTLRPSLGSHPLSGGSHFAVVTNPELINLLPPQGVAVKLCQSTDGSLWASPNSAPTGQGPSVGTRAARPPSGPWWPCPVGQQASPAAPAEVRCAVTPESSRPQAPSQAAQPSQLHKGTCFNCFSLVVFKSMGLWKACLKVSIKLVLKNITL